PGADVHGGGVDIDGEVEVVADGHPYLAVRAGPGRLEDVEALDDEDIGAAHRDAGSRDDVVGVVRVDGGAHLLRTGFHGGHEAQQAAPIVGLGEALAAAEPPAGQLRI